MRPSDGDHEKFRSLPNFDNATAERAIAAAGGLREGRWIRGDGAWTYDATFNVYNEDGDGDLSPPSAEELSCAEFVDVLHPGDVLILPGQWYHTTRSLDAWTVSVSYVDYRAVAGLTVPATAKDVPNPKYRG